jgi:hypothetical protein
MGRRPSFRDHLPDLLVMVMQTFRCLEEPMPVELRAVDITGGFSPVGAENPIRTSDLNFQMG